MARRRAERQAKCAVCRLSDAIKEQLRIAKEKGYSTQDRLSYLQTVAPHITELDWKGHGSGAHDTWEKAGL